MYIYNPAYQARSGVRIIDKMPGLMHVSGKFFIELDIHRSRLLPPSWTPIKKALWNERLMLPIIATTTPSGPINLPAEAVYPRPYGCEINEKW